MQVHNASSPAVPIPGHKNNGSTNCISSELSMFHSFRPEERSGRLKSRIYVVLWRDHGMVERLLRTKTFLRLHRDASAAIAYQDDPPGPVVDLNQRKIAVKLLSLAKSASPPFRLKKDSEHRSH
jgi:hypothetical protein